MRFRFRVAIDAHTIGRRATGNETYVRGLLGGLIATAETDLVILTDPKTTLPPEFEERAVRLDRSTAVPRLLFELAHSGRQWRVSLLHVQYVRPLRSDVPVITTIHDISYEHFPGLFTRRSRARMRVTIPWSARRSSAVLTGSNYSKQDLVHRYRLPPEHVWVTPYAADPSFRPIPEERFTEVLERIGLPRDYLLYVGNLQPRKNLPRLLNAYVRLPADRPPLVVVGQRAWLDHEVFATFRRRNLQGSVYFVGYVPQEDLPAIYSGALAFAYPSLFEGFGLPVLEAMACGTPTLTSDTSSLPEVAGDAAVLVDPRDVDAIRDGLERLLGSHDLRRSLRERGLRQAQHFSWNRCATETVKAYRSVLS